MSKSLLVLAAGMGSRYGGLKQLDGMGPNGATIIDYSVYDAVHAGFEKLVFVIRPHFEDEFREKLTRKYEQLAEVVLVHQEKDSPIRGIDSFPEREKPWGTGHAVLVAADAIREPFAVINADDYYGREAFGQMADFLSNRVEPDLHSLIGYKLGNTLSENGTVSRGVCKVDESDMTLISINERTKIQAEPNGIFYTDAAGAKHPLMPNDYVSMNFWGFHPSIMDSYREGFIDFLDNYSDPKSEFFIPITVDGLISSDKAKFEVIPSNSKWIGVTYQEDRQPAADKFQEMATSGYYPELLFN